MTFLQRLFHRSDPVIHVSQVPLLDLTHAEVSMKRVYLLSEELRQDPRQIRLAQALTQDKGRPNMGLRGTHGLFASPEWWENINRGKMPLRRTTGVIRRLYEAGQDRTGVSNCFDLEMKDGCVVMESIYVNERADSKLFRVGSSVEVLYALEESKRRSEDGRPEVSDIVLEMAVSVGPG